ncbi:Glycosidase [Duganella sp. CF517]|uniref:glycoside hydrolase family 13 protein n=1 Tax=Duganella sp. CF517 TaxID=1881038 RepID=UPI0008D328EE|nr:glycoside hydrolase family 13 protein [Duganella sp. CF517]SEO18881.1 Glycosidase [Duganella sp. CF517]
MKKILMTGVLLGALLPAFADTAGYRIEHMEPPLWWTGMHSGKLQLMVHGPAIADLEPSLDYPGVRIASVSRVANKNYLFIDVDIAPDAAPGKLDLTFRRAGQILRHPYQLLARDRNSAQRIGFNSADAIYQVMPDRFANGDPANDSVAAMADKADRAERSGRHGGDIKGIADHLDYVADMGYTVIWPTPLLESDMPAHSYHGYATTNHYRIDPRYGSNAEYRDLVARARAKGLGVIQDVVLNHIGARHWWLQDLPTPDWLTYQGRFVPTAHHRTAVQDPYASAADRRNFTAGWFARGMPDLNQANPFVATYLIQNNIWWIEYAGLAGLRVDTYGYSDTAFLSRWSGSLMAEYPRLNLVGEEWSTLAPVVAHWQRGKRNFDGYVSHMPSMMDFPLTDALRRALAAPDGDERGLTDLYEALSLDHVYPDPGNLVLFEGNHDMSRIYSELHADEGLFRMAMAFVATAPRIPQFYTGSEILMTSTTKGRDDPSYRQDLPGGWRGDAVNAFTGAGLSAPQAAAQAWVKKVLNWRKGAAVIHHGRTMHFGPEQNTYVYFRYDDTKKVMVALNKNKTDTVLKTARFREILGAARAGVDVPTGRRVALDGEITLPARSALILEIEQ